MNLHRCENLISCVRAAFPRSFCSRTCFCLKNNDGSLHPCSHKYRMSGWQVSNIKNLYVRSDCRYIHVMFTIHLSLADAKNYWIINCPYLSIHSTIPHRLLGWRVELFVCLTKYSKIWNDCRQLNSHIRCDIQSVTIFRFCCCIFQKLSFAGKLWEMEQVWALHL